mgnify:CR=1 FL=1|jgi:hypothetical protein|tara:strand:- start:34375 stop:35127 length:753 start_codon:yes stop_codon:yes gene_type:complete
MKKTVEYVDKQYKLLGNTTPLSFMLSSRNTRRFPLLWFDEEKGENRALRYARNQKSPFEDEQDGNAILEPIIFDDGFLTVPKNNQVLQKFLEIHPANGVKYSIIDKAKEAKDIVEDLNLEADALIAARELTIDQIEAVTRVAFGTDPSTITSSELRRDILLFAKNNPEGFLMVVNDSSLQIDSKVQSFFDKGVLAFRKNKKEVFFNTPSNKKRMLTVPFGEEPLFVVSSYLQSDEGLEVLEHLEKVAETK